MIITQLRGGLGNQMFQYAFGKAVAHRHTTGLKLDLVRLLYRNNNPKAVFRDYDLDVFVVNPHTTLLSKIESLVKPRSQKVSELFVRLNNLQNSFHKIFNKKYEVIEVPNQFSMSVFDETSKNCHLSGYWQSAMYFGPIEKELRKDFAFRDPILPISLELKEKIETTESVCLHVRRGDFIQENKVIENDFYDRAYKKMHELVPNGTYFIFSDDIEWCKTYFTFIPNVTFVEDIHAGRKTGNQLHLMSLCKHFIVPNSTYSWWAAWLSGNPKKQIVSLATWVQAKVVITDIVPDEWHKV